jgi:ferric-dicitrate binding protein FerR (iron transport regulator)
LEFIETPLDDVIEYLRDGHRCQIHLDPRMADAGRTIRVTANLKDVSLQSALKLILSDQGLTPLVSAEYILVTSSSEAPALRRQGMQEPNFKTPEIEANNKKVAAALAAPAKRELDFLETPLADVVDYLREFQQIPIFVQETQIKQAGIDLKTPITGQWQDMSLRSALQLILRKPGLTFVARDEALVIMPAKGPSVRRPRQ